MWNEELKERVVPWIQIPWIQKLYSVKGELKCSNCRSIVNAFRYLLHQDDSVLNKIYYI